MPRTSGTAIESNFIMGLVTEVTPLKYPPNACTETYDCVFDSTGEVSRRLAFAHETGALTPVLDSTSTEAITEYQWTGVAGLGSKSFIVIQHGRYLRFYNNSLSNSLSANRETFTVDLNSYMPSSPTVDPSVYPCSYAQGDGKLFVANRGINPIYIAYDATGNSIITTAITLRERDFTGAVETGWDDNERYTGAVLALAAADPNHWYNLLNQSWHTNMELPTSSATAAIKLWDAGRTELPSNNDTPWLYIGATGALIGVFDVSTVERRGPGTVRAPRGHFILDVFGPSRTQAQIDTNLDVAYRVTVTGDRTDNKERPQAIAFFAGRIWYAGINQSDLSSSIYFTRIVENTEQYGRCYQVNDPTTENLTDLLPSDGGVIKIPEIAEIVRLIPFRTSLMIFATNGIWIVEGSNGQGFTANDYAVKQISTLGVRSKQSFVNFKNLPVWWGEESILSVKYDANYNSFEVISLTDNTIWTFLQAIPKVSREYVKGTYDVRNDIIYWVYNSNSVSSGSYYTYNRVLALDGTSKAFYPWTINSAGSRVIRGMIYSQPASTSIQGTVKFLTSVTASSITETLTFGETSSSSYMDWGSSDYTSYFITGYRVDGQGNKNFQSNYVTTLFNRESTASCFLQGYFDWSSSENSGKWSTVQQVYNDSATRAVTHTRRKIRGKGPSLQLKFTSESGKPFSLIGWVIWITGSQGI